MFNLNKNIVWFLLGRSIYYYNASYIKWRIQSAKAQVTQESCWWRRLADQFAKRGLFQTTLIADESQSYKVL